MNEYISYCSTTFYKKKILSPVTESSTIKNYYYLNKTDDAVTGKKRILK